MNPPCQRCSKAVYPMEKLKCLDLFWHKQCFKCEECGTTLNLKTYKGYNKKPYCTAHCPKSSFTTVAETPEMLRLKQLSEQQSQINYHKDFEGSKGKYTQVAEDPELKRHLQNTKILSSVKYHAEFEKQKGQKLSVDTDPEIERTKRNMATISNAEYHNLKQQRNEQEKRRPSDAEQYNPPIRRRGTEVNPRPVSTGGMARVYSATENDPSPYSSRSAPRVAYSSTGDYPSSGGSTSKPIGSIFDKEDPLQEDEFYQQQMREKQRRASLQRKERQLHGLQGFGFVAQPQPVKQASVSESTAKRSSSYQDQPGQGRPQSTGAYDYQYDTGSGYDHHMPAHDRHSTYDQHRYSDYEPRHAEHDHHRSDEPKKRTIYQPTPFSMTDARVVKSVTQDVPKSSPQGNRKLYDDLESRGFSTLEKQRRSKASQQLEPKVQNVDRQNPEAPKSQEPLGYRNDVRGYQGEPQKSYPGDSRVDERQRGYETEFRTDQSTAYQSEPAKGYNEPQLGYNERHRGYGEPQTSYTEPRRGYDEPQKGYNEPDRGFSEPQRGYSEPQRGYNEPENGYGEPQRGYNDQQQGYNEPPKGYTEPQKGYSEPQKGYSEAQRGYNEPPKGYSEPQRGYIEPQKGYSEPQRGYSEQDRGYTDSQRGYNEPQKGYMETAIGYDEYNQNQRGYSGTQPAFKEPQPGYKEPAVSYNEPPQQGYKEPAVSYNEPPQTGYKEPAVSYNEPPRQGYKEPAVSYNEPAKSQGSPQKGSYTDAPRGYNEPPAGYTQDPRGYAPEDKGYEESRQAYREEPASRGYPEPAKEEPKKSQPEETRTFQYGAPLKGQESPRMNPKLGYNDPQKGFTSAEDLKMPDLYPQMQNNNNYEPPKSFPEPQPVSSGNDTRGSYYSNGQREGHRTPTKEDQKRNGVPQYLKEQSFQSPYSARSQPKVAYSSVRDEPAPQTHKIGSVADLDPMRNERNDHRHSSGGQYGGQPGYQHAPAQQQTSGRGDDDVFAPNTRRLSGPRSGSRLSSGGGTPTDTKSPVISSPVGSALPPMPAGPRYQALYDYTAGDDDEVSFMEGDIIVDTEVIDPGWMTGRVERTGKMGMLPSNYVERI